MHTIAFLFWGNNIEIIKIQTQYNTIQVYITAAGYFDDLITLAKTEQACVTTTSIMIK